MDSTRALPSTKHSSCVSSSQKGSSVHCYNAKNNGGMYTIGNTNGGQILMNSRDINKATHLQFSPPKRSKSTANISQGSPSKSNDHHCSIYTSTAPLMCQTPVCQDIGKSIIVDTMATKELLSAVIRQTQNNCSSMMNTAFMAKLTTRKSSSMHSIADDKAVFIQHSETFANYYETQTPSTTTTSSSMPSQNQNNNFNGNFGGNMVGSSNDGNKLVNSIKSFFSAIIRPIIDTTSLIVGNDTRPQLNSNGIGQTVNNTDFVNGNDSKFETQNSMDNIPFFDCDDFIEGGEDQVDFVADSTKFEWQQTNNHHSNAQHFDDLIMDEVKARSLSKENIFYDCMPTIGMDSSIKQPQIEQQQIQHRMSPDSKAIKSTIDKSMVIDEMVWKPMATATDNCDNKNIKTDVNVSVDDVADCNSLKIKIQTKIDDNKHNTKHDDNVQYENDKNEVKPKKKSSIIITPSIVSTSKLDAIIPDRHSYRRRKQKRNIIKRTNNRSNNCHKNSASNKNRHEKSRHELEMNIHDDIEEIFSDDLPNLSSTNPLHRQNQNTEASEINQDEDGDADADDIDLEIIDMDTIRPTTSLSLNIQSKSSHKLNTSIISTSSTSSDESVDNISPITPEPIPSGCIFTLFYRFDDNKSTNQCPTLPDRLAQKLSPPHNLRSMQSELNLSLCRTSETESDDSFIVFEDHSSNDPLKGCYSRQRQFSDSDDDDFICFERDDDSDGNDNDDDDDDEEEEDETDEDDLKDSSDDDETDESDSESDNESESEVSEEKQEHETNQPDSGFEEKKVSFNLRPKVFVIRAWTFAYVAARKSEWEQIGRDRVRFESRIKDINRVIAPVLKAEHRQKIFNERFMEPQIQPQPQPQSHQTQSESHQN